MDSIYEIVGKRIKEMRLQKDKTLQEIGDLVDVHKSTVQRWENGSTEKISLAVIEMLANYFNVNPAWLSGKNVPKYSIPIKNIQKNIIPVLGVVKAGYNYLAQENIIDTISIDFNPADLENYYALQIVGDSMEPLFSNGDIAVVHKQDNFESGNTCIVLVNGDEATVKKVIKKDDGIELIAMNPYYPARKFTFEEIAKFPVQIIGKVVEARKRKIFE